MKIDYISDLHLDTYINGHENVEQCFINEFKNVFINVGDILVIAGDIGEFNDQNIICLKTLLHHFKYKDIVLVLGNHDYFLSHREDKEKYAHNSLLRVQEFQHFIEKEPRLHLLDGNTVEINGVVFGGTMGWYDASYLYKNLNPYYSKDEHYVERLWKEYHPDYDNIYFQDDENMKILLKTEMKKVRKIYKKCDVLITHVSPSNKVEHTEKKYQKSDNSAFFSFDGADYLKNTSALYWIFGHSHDIKVFKFGDVYCLSNPYGYPDERKKAFKLAHINYI